MAVDIEKFNDSMMRKLFPQAWAQATPAIRPCDEGTERPRADKAVQFKSTPLSVPIKEKVSDLKEPEASTPELFSLQEENQPEDKPAGVKPIAGAKSAKKPFDFDAHIKDYEERRIKGQRDEQRILNALEGNERAQDYVKLYFASVSVMWDVDKFRQRIKEDIAVWTSLREKYGDGKITNYSRSIATGELLLETLGKLY